MVLSAMSKKGVIRCTGQFDSGLIIQKNKQQKQPYSWKQDREWDKSSRRRKVRESIQIKVNLLKGEVETNMNKTRGTEAEKTCLEKILTWKGKK